MLTINQIYKTEMYNYTLLAIMQCFYTDLEHFFNDDYICHYKNTLNGYFECVLEPRDKDNNMDMDELKELFQTNIERIMSYKQYRNSLIISDIEDNTFEVYLNYTNNYDDAVL